MGDLTGSVVVYGSGRMGSQIALEYARGGFDVTCVARRPTASAELCTEAAGLLVDLGVAAREPVRMAGERIRFLTPDDLGHTPAPDIVVESLPEDFTLKADLLRPLARRWDHTIFASNTSSFSITRLGDTLDAGDRVVGTHYLNPPLLMPPVEVVPGQHTDPAVSRRVVDVLVTLGKRPIVVHHDIPGFVWNRLQFALLREAVWLVENGVATTNDIDQVIENGLARRWKAAGPFRTAALGGVTTFVNAAREILPDLSDAIEIDGLHRALQGIDPGELHAAARRRETALAADLTSSAPVKT